MKHTIVFAAILALAVPSLAAAQTGYGASSTGKNGTASKSRKIERTGARRATPANVGSGAGSPSALDTATGRSTTGAGSASSSMGNAASSK